MIWFSPGWPLLTGPSIEYTRKDEEGFFNSIVATLQRDCERPM